MSTPGKLYIVSTPIGNLGDITQRALETLREVDLIMAEDTRHTKQLLNHFSITNRLKSLHDHNEKEQAQSIVTLLNEGNNIALVSDAGTPLISDPGYGLVNVCREEGMDVHPVPGACAAIAALSCSGLPTDQFRFDGFIPAKSAARKAYFESLTTIEYTVVAYESTHRLLDSLKDFSEVFGDERTIVLSKEITKRFETFFTGNAKEILAWIDEEPERKKGEIVLMFKGEKQATDAISSQVLQLASQLCEHMPAKKAAAICADHFPVKKNLVYKALLEIKQSD
ncbi:16S rRNA (cytidine(1402)-2'-O)-methyltransferase [Algicola sagamiensis]|uniref:16S rRNA (cytidine(1402)-2'-O)-methyltransferase n=1 Tax=Algicola sagamiensis TaxID=163869 RepID=UPI000364A8AD|nr:16S rRNA (cytidine(1402)-2'-O)-methyltransferase [Algicola sagamiensis]